MTIRSDVAPQRLATGIILTGLACAAGITSRIFQAESHHRRK
jgi:hypothetical protein